MRLCASDYIVGFLPAKCPVPCAVYLWRCVTNYELVVHTAKSYTQIFSYEMVRGVNYISFPKRITKNTRPKQ